MNNKTMLWTIVPLIALVVGVVWYIYPSSKPDAPTGPTETVTIGIVPQFSLLVLLAEKQDFFKENGLNVVIKNYEAGPGIVKDLVAGTLDFGVVGEFVFVLNSFQEEDIKILTSISTSDSIQIMARRDHDIEKPFDLKDKKIGVTRNSSAEFFLYRFLELNNITQQEVTVINLPPAAVVSAIINGEVDAAVPFSNDILKIENDLGGKVTSWPAQNSLDTHTLLLGNGTSTKNYAGAVDRLLRALKQSEEYAHANAEDTREFLAETAHMKFEDAVAFYSQFKFELTLAQSLIIILENEARFAIKNGLAEKHEVPNYLDFIHFDALKKVKPEAVTIIH